MSHHSHSAFGAGVSRRRMIAATMAAGFGSAGVLAQSYPSRLMTMLVGFPAGGQADATARIFLPALQKALGQAIVVENAAGVGGSLGAQKALAAPANGHTIYFGTPIELVQTPMALAGVKYKPENFRMVGLMASTYLMMLVRPDLPVTSVSDFAALAKKQGRRELSFGSVGHGSAYHLVAERFGKETGSKLLHVPYKGAQQLITDLAGGQIDMAFLAMGGPVPGLIKTGRLKAIGFTGPGRHEDFPNVQTMNESNVVKDFQFDLWGALMVPASTPESVVSTLSSALQDALNLQQVRRDIEATGAVPAKPMTPSQATLFYSAEIARYQNIGKAINLRPE